MFVKPVAGRRVLDPVTFAPVPPDGRDVPATSYWLRRLRDGDLVTAAPAAAPTASAHPSAAPAAAH